MRIVLLSMLLGCAKQSGTELPQWPVDEHNSSEPLKATETPEVEEGAERWLLNLEVGNQELELIVDFFPNPDGWSANLGVPRQGVLNVPMRGVEYDDSEWTFVNYKLRFPSLSEVYRGNITGDTATGTMTLWNNSFVFEAQRSEKGPGG